MQLIALTDQHNLTPADDACSTTFATELCQRAPADEPRDCEPLKAEQMIRARRKLQV
jgi:hypothetical protein